MIEKTYRLHTHTAMAIMTIQEIQTLSLLHVAL